MFDRVRRRRGARRFVGARVHASFGPVVDWEALLAGRWSIVQTRARSPRLRFLAVAHPAAGDPRRALSPRERRVIEAVARGESNKAVALDLGLGPAALATILGRALRKLGVPRREHLSRLAAALRARAPAEPAARRRGSERPDAPACRLQRSPGGASALWIELDAAPTPASLTASERAIVALVLAGHSGAEIAAGRGRSYRTIANQLAAIYRKFAVHSRAELVALLSGAREA